MLPLSSFLDWLCVPPPIGVLSFNDEDKYCRVVDLNAIPFNLPSRTTTQQINRKHPFSKNDESCSWLCCWLVLLLLRCCRRMDGRCLLERRSFKYIFVKYCFVLCMSCCHVRRQEEQNINSHVSTKAISSASLSFSSNFLFNDIPNGNGDDRPMELNWSKDCS